MSTQTRFAKATKFRPPDPHNGSCDSRWRLLALEIEIGRGVASRGDGLIWWSTISQNPSFAKNLFGGFSTALVDRTLFEETLFTASRAPVGDASSAAITSMTTSASDLEGEAQAVSALLDAAKRLEKNPSLFSGDPNGVFRYEDPILAVAALWGRSADVFEQHLLSSASAIEGSNLRKRSVWKWMVK